jgi:hypothetical protein
MTILAELFQESAQLEAEIRANLRGRGMKSEGRLTELPAGYAAILANLKDQIRSARIKAALAVNRELVLLYWRIGRRILK